MSVLRSHGPRGELDVAQEQPEREVRPIGAEPPLRDAGGVPDITEKRLGHRGCPSGVGVVGVLPQVRGSPRRCVRESLDHQEVPHAKLLRRHVGGIDDKDLLGQREREIRHAGVVQRTRKCQSGLDVSGCVFDGPDPLGDSLLMLAEVPADADEGHSCPRTGLVEL